MTPLEYAQAIARRYAFAIVGENVKGSHHVPRVPLCGYKYFLNRKIGLPNEKICTSRSGDPHWFTSLRIFNEFKVDLYTAGLDAEAEHYYEPRRLILSRKHWLTAAGVLRLTGQPIAPDPRVARRVAGILKARRTRMQNECQRGLSEAEELQRRERAALLRAESTR
jgi:hypothetical protein